MEGETLDLGPGAVEAVAQLLRGLLVLVVVQTEELPLHSSLTMATSLLVGGQMVERLAVGLAGVLVLLRAILMVVAVQLLGPLGEGAVGL